MSGSKISAAADAGTVQSTDMIPIARSGSSTAYHVTGTEVLAYARSATATNDSAAAGTIGEFTSIIVTTAVSLTTGTTANVATLPLTAGDWTVQGELWLTIAGTATIAEAGINTVSGIVPTSPAIGSARAHIAASLSGTLVMPLGPTRVSLAASGSAYLVANCTFTGGTCTAIGVLSARRPR